jgi:2-phospho-L-lactate guanylyltransferase (CobY/MobA/RfbA family)
MKATAAFKMKRTTKYQLASFTDQHERGEFKRAMIQAQLASAIRVKDKRPKPGQPQQEE